MKEPKITFYLKSLGATNRPVIMKFNFGYKETNPLTNKTKYVPLVYNTRLKLKESGWDFQKNLPLAPSDQLIIRDIKDKSKTVYKYLIDNSIEVNPNLLRSELDVIFKRKKRTNNVVEICEYIEKEICTRTNDFDRKTLAHYDVLTGKLRTYEKENKIILTTSNLNREHYLGFQNQCKKNLGTANSVWGVMKDFKSALTKLRRDYKHITFFKPSEELSDEEKVQRVNDPNVYMDLQMIQKLMKYEPKNEKYSNVKLILLTLLFSGCRYSDVFKVIPNKEFDDGRNKFRYAHFITKKDEGEEVIIPFLKPLEDAFKQNKDKPAREISLTKFNNYVKDLCAYVGFIDEVQLAYTNSQGKKAFIIEPFYKRVSSHIGRRSFITNLINVIPVTVLSKITGHRYTTKEVIFNYNKTTLIQNALLFYKEIRRVSTDPDRKEEFPIQLV